MKNITVSVPEEVYRRARVMAAERDSSVSALVKEFLTGLGREESDFERGKRLQDEVLATMQDLANQGTNILTLGQYLQPTREHLPVVRYVHPDEFAEFKVLGEAMGFNHVEAGPLVRSSYHAFEQTESAQK